MRMDDMILVSIDDHMIEPPDMYTNHLPAKWADEHVQCRRESTDDRRLRRRTCRFWPDRPPSKD